MTPREEIERLAIYLEGMADAMATQPQVNPMQGHSALNIPRPTQAQRILAASRWLAKTAPNVCGQGYIGCLGGDKCGSDHK